MKKVLFVLLLTSFLAACGDSSSTEEESNNRAEEENNDSQTEEVASETSNEEPVADTQKKLGLKTEDIFHAELFEDQEESLQSYDYENMKIDVVDNDPFRIFVYYIDDSEYASGLVLRNNGNNKDLSQETFDFFYNDMDESIQNASRQFKRADGDNYLIGVIFNGEIDIDNPPIDLSEISGKDFFLDEENVELYRNALNTAEYQEIYNKATSYLDDNEVSEYDSANEIIEILEPIQDYMDEIEVEYDDFDDVSTLYYQGLNDISSENYIVPFITTEENSMNLLIGFEKENWLFAENVIFNIDGERESFGTFDFDTETLGGRLIREEDIKTNIDDELIEEIVEADEVKMRFEGSKGELDYTLTANDINAIKTISSFNGIRNELSNLLHRFENN
ncbi:hypothetical protein [Oceanobacillus oncorhynchi]|uniref:hypothetical protein n=1 Tax=Oceanobacillus oncorhynchi TaxID=545501 RepID=UPI002116A1BA|nr:hypothetical protein [Oceanobacillus oncorhynchi]UUI41139.1 hypothetical protein NP440_06115 [Oceanobacillus oncorhynchi]